MNQLFKLWFELARKYKGILPAYCRLGQAYKLTLESDENCCKSCSCKLTVKWIAKSKPKGLLIGQPHVVEKIKVCPECNAIYMAEIIPLLRPAFSNYCYDVIVEVGECRYRYFMQDSEIQDRIFRNYKILIPLSTVSALARRFVQYVAAVHYKNCDKIKRVLAENPAFVLNIDGTCEVGTSTFFVLMDNATGFILHCGKMPAERKENIAELLQFCSDSVGKPDAVIQDLSPRIFDAVKEVLPESRLLVCHFHFLENIGKKILMESHTRLGSIVKKLKIGVSIRTLRSDLGKQAKKHDPISEEQLNDFFDNSDKTVRDPRQLIRYIAYILGLWFADYKSDLNGEYFPFDLPHLSLYRRCQKLYALLKRAKASYSDKEFRKLNSISTLYSKLEDFCCNDKVIEAADELIKAETYFDELRELLKMKTADRKPILRQREPEANPQFFCKMEKELGKYMRKLQGIIDKTENKFDKFCVQTILGYFEKYAEHLIAHIVHDKNSNQIYISPRTNNIIERLFGWKKAALRRKIGKKKLVSHFQAMLPEEFLVQNLFNDKYRQLVLGSVDVDLVALFSTTTIDHRQVENNSTLSGLNIKVRKKLLREEDLLEKICTALVASKHTLIGK